MSFKMHEHTKLHNRWHLRLADFGFYLKCKNVSSAQHVFSCFSLGAFRRSPSYIRTHSPTCSLSHSCTQTLRHSSQWFTISQVSQVIFHKDRLTVLESKTWRILNPLFFFTNAVNTLFCFPLRHSTWYSTMHSWIFLGGWYTCVFVRLPLSSERRLKEDEINEPSCGASCLCKDSYFTF